ncbi:MAG: hypothetical protein HPY85_13830 [Anaerolineae bacterium]|nr:hypothetical protein [Anaerolineae bacterium]
MKTAITRREVLKLTLLTASALPLATCNANLGQSEKAEVADLHRQAAQCQSSVTAKYTYPMQPPEGYPTESAIDPYRFEPDGTTFAERKQEFIDFLLQTPSPEGGKSPFVEVLRLANGLEPNHKALHDALDQIDQRLDTADFGMQVLLWLLFKFEDNPLLHPDMTERIRQTVFNFKYWPEEPGVDDMCTWTENHQILFATAAYLFGQRYPDAVFTNSCQTGREKMERNRSRIMRWLELRYQTGFSEWLSNVYYVEDLAPLFSLIEFAEDEEIIARASMVTDLMLLDLALNTFHGIFASSHGRSYERHKKESAGESTSGLAKVCFGMGSYRNSLCMVPFVLSTRYTFPPVIEAIGQDISRPAMLNRQRTGILIDEAGQLGLKLDNFEDAMRFLSLEAYLHPKTAPINLALFDAYQWWDNSFLSPMKDFRGLLNGLKKTGTLPLVLGPFEWDACRNTREAADITTYRTPDIMLSSAEEYRVGYGGDQQSIWQAIIGENATTFTTHPGPFKNGTPDYWTGSGILPHVRQVENVLLCIYHIHKKPTLYAPTRYEFTHAWLPQTAFDEFRQEGRWCFARKARGYLALYSAQPTRWQDDNDLIADGRKNVWIVEMGSEIQNGSFADFTQQILEAVVNVNGLSVEYHSPSQGKLSLRWKGKLYQNDELVPMQRHPRYSNPYLEVEYPAREIKVDKETLGLRLNFSENQRSFTG